MSDHPSVWELAGEEYVGENAIGMKYLKPKRSGVKQHMSWATDLPRWIVWEWDGAQKIPHRGAHPTAKSSWQEVENGVTFDEAWESYEAHDHLAGIGFIFSEELPEVLEDFDDVLDPNSGEFTHDVAADALETDEPAFISSSGTGMHRYPVAKTASGTDRHPHEVYVTSRFAAVTGHRITDGEHGNDLSTEIDRLSSQYNQSSGPGADIGDIEFDSEPVKLDEGDWEPPEELQNAPRAVLALVKALSTEHPDDVGWGQNTFGRYSYLLMLLASFDSNEQRMAELASSFYCPMIAETQEGNHFKKPAAEKPHGLGVPWDLEEQVSYISRKIRNGDLTPPSVSKIEEKANVEIGTCDCPIHGETEDEEKNRTAFPRAILRNKQGQERRDAVMHHRAKMDVLGTLGQKLETSMIYQAPQGMKKTVHSSRGAAHHPRLIITSNKDEHRETCHWATHDMDVDVHEIVPFGDSWLASDVSPVQDQVLKAYHAGVHGKLISEKFSHYVPEEVDCEYADQFDEKMDADLLLGSPGHENVKQFRTFEQDGEDIHREIIADDVEPFDQEITENAFSLQDSADELNQLVQFIPELAANTAEQVISSSQMRSQVGRMVETGGEEVDEESEEIHNVWDALDAEESTNDAIGVDIVQAVLECDDVTGKSLTKLKVLVGEESHNIERIDIGETYSWVQHPDLSDHRVAVTSSTPTPNTVETWLEESGVEDFEHKNASDDWRAVRRAQGITAVKCVDKRNSRSGIGGGYRDNDDYSVQEVQDYADAIETVYGNRPGIVDAKRALDMGDVDDEDSINQARVKSNNKMKDREVGIVAGATYYGDEYVRLRAAYAGVQTEILHESRKRAYADTEVGQEIMEHMVQASVDQAIPRFGREDGVEATVFVLTDEIPEEWPTIDITDKIVKYTESQRDVHRAVVDGARSAKDVREHVDVGPRQIRNILKDLVSMNLLTVEENALENGASEYEGNGNYIENILELPSLPRSGSRDDRSTELEGQMVLDAPDQERISPDAASDEAPVSEQKGVFGWEDIVNTAD